MPIQLGEQLTMTNRTIIHQGAEEPTTDTTPPEASCVLVIFGASGDLTKRLLTPALYNLACDGLLPGRFAIIGVAKDEWSTEQFREHLTRSIKEFNTRKEFDSTVWDGLVRHVHYIPRAFEDPQTYNRLASMMAKVEPELKIAVHVLLTLP